MKLCTGCGRTKPAQEFGLNRRRRPICRDSPAAHIDHDHDTGQVRGLLCFNCNAGLGQFEDRTELLAAAVDYLNVNRGIADARRPRVWPRVIELFPYREPCVEVEVRTHRRSVRVAGIAPTIAESARG